MKWNLHPRNNDITTSLPLTVEIHEWTGKPRVFVSGVGELSLKPQGKILKSDFYFSFPGEYNIEVRDLSSKESLLLDVKEHQYLDFNNEFGFFFVLFLFVMGGIILWTKKIMKS